MKTLTLTVAACLAAIGLTSDECEHTIGRSDCPFCTPEIIKSRGFCLGHGVPEALCVKCSPFLEAAFKAKGDWCNEHNTPESQCAICNPPVAGEIKEPPNASNDGRRSRREPNPGCAKTKDPVRFNSLETARTAGLDLVVVGTRRIIQTINRNAELAYDAARYARVTSRTAGVVTEIRKNLGDAVGAGEVVAIMDAPIVGDAKAGLLRAVESVGLWETSAQRARSLVDQGVGAERESLEADAKLAESRISLAAARQRLRSMGLTDEDIAFVEEHRDLSTRLPLKAPMSGVVVERPVVVGESVESGTAIMTTADTSVLWAMIDLFAEDLVRVRTGQRVTLSADGVSGEVFAGPISWISTRMDEKSRTLHACAEISNDDGLLRAGLFARAHVVVGSEEPVLAVPNDAVQWEGCCNVVFVKANDEGTEFQPRQIRLGAEDADGYEVRSGLVAGETVVTRGSFLLKTEILKGAIGAGCCEVGHLAK